MTSAESRALIPASRRVIKMGRSVAYLFHLSQRSQDPRARARAHDREKIIKKHLRGCGTLIFGDSVARAPATKLPAIHFPSFPSGRCAPPADVYACARARAPTCGKSWDLMLDLARA